MLSTRRARGEGECRSRRAGWNHQQSWRSWVVGSVLSGCVVLAGATAARVEAQVINEVISNNETTPPSDIGGVDRFEDMVEIFNPTDEAIVLGTTTVGQSYMLSDTAEFDPLRAWAFPSGRSTLPPGGRLVIFCDGDIAEGTCELHATFGIANDGTEPVSLWGPVDPGTGERPLVDQVWLPPLSNDVSFGRFPDGAGPAPCPVGETFDHFVYFPEGSFGVCAEVPGVCILGRRRFCGGAPNENPGNIAPRISRTGHSSNAPEAGEAVVIQARIRDEDPRPLAQGGQIASARIVYRVIDGAGAPGPLQEAALSYDGAGILTGAPARPTDIFTHWEGTIPGQAAGTRVEFWVEVSDNGEGGVSPLSDVSPGNLCPEGIGPCDRQFGPAENGCERDLGDIVDCPDPSDPDVEIPFIGERWISCDAPWTYAVGYAPRAAVAGIVINEVVPLNDGLLLDETEPRCTADNLCPPENPDCCRNNEDFLELYNASDSPIDLAGCWLSDSYFDPRRWQFPPNSPPIPPGAYAIVWLDNDGGQCPDPDRLDPPCFWECPDPNEVSMANLEWHANFALNADGDQIFLFDDEANQFGLIHGLDFSVPADFPGYTENEQIPDGMGGFIYTNPGEQVLANQSLSLLPNGDRAGCWVIADPGTPWESNVAEATCGGDVTFRRGDANDDGGLDLSDGVYVLNYLFTGGPAPSCPDAADSNDDGALDLSDGVFVLNFLFTGGPQPPAPYGECGPDPTEDPLPACVTDECP